MTLSNFNSNGTGQTQDKQKKFGKHETQMNFYPAKKNQGKMKTYTNSFWDSKNGFNKNNNKNKNDKKPNKDDDSPPDFSPNDG